ncbi:MAG: M20 family metallopeptidase [Ruminococcus sp.]|nr:M20 family metallopeptidase [Ruminococcus sp.]
MDPKELLEKAEETKDTLVRFRRELHKNPGTGFDIPFAEKYVKNELDRLGIPWKKCGRSGVTAVIGGKKTGKCFMIRADMDALPINEASGEEFSSENGNMHACGHDMHTAMLLGAAKLLKDREDEIQGSIKLMFQPAEEIFEGSKDMINGGLLEDPHVDAALMIHVISAVPLEEGTVVVSSPGISSPGADYFSIEVQGKGCHGSMPHTGIDPITASARIITGLQEISARELALGERAVITVGCINAGNAANVIPDSAVIKGSIRTFEDGVRSRVAERIKEISEGIASAFRCKASVSFEGGCPSLLNDKSISECAEKYVTELLGRSKTLTSASMGGSGGSGSEDFAYVSRRVPSVMLALAAGHPKDGYIYPQHHPMIKFSENVLASGSAVYAYTALRWLEETK